MGNKRYLIVLEDVWHTDVWDGIKAAFSDNSNGSRILLNKDDSWELFSKKALHVDPCHLELKNEGRLIAEKCNGLPLYRGGGWSLSKERQINPTVVSNGIECMFVSQPGTREILRCISTNLRRSASTPEALFFVLWSFPKDFEIPARQLILLWIAEEFVKQDKNRTTKDVAEGYLAVLINRSLIMVVKRSSYGSIKSCCIHDLLRDLSITEGVQENFLAVHSEKDISSTSSTSTAAITTTKPRRLSIHCVASTYMCSTSCDSSRVHSLVCFGGQDELSIKMFHSLYKRFPLLRVLDLGSTRCFPH